MEQRISLQTTPQFVLTTEERRALYLRLALFQYRVLRNPDYDEEVLLKTTGTRLQKVPRRGALAQQAVPQQSQHP